MSTSTYTSEVQREEREAQQQLRRLERARKAKARKAAERKRNAPRLLAQVERKMAALNDEYKRLPAFPEGRERRAEIRKEIRDLGQERLDLKYGKGGE